MISTRRTAIWVGVLYIAGTVAGILSVVFTGPVFEAQDYLQQLATNARPLQLGAMFVLIMGLALSLMAALMYPILKKHNEGLATSFVIFRGALEPLTYFPTVACWLALPWLGREFVAAGTLSGSFYQTLGSLLNTITDQNSLLTVFAFGLGALILYILLYQTNLIPRWISIFGLIAIVLHLCTGFLMLFGVMDGFSTWDVVMNLPIAVQEMVMAVWFIAKGFNPSAQVIKAIEAGKGA